MLFIRLVKCKCYALLGSPSYDVILTRTPTDKVRKGAGGGGEPHAREEAGGTARDSLVARGAWRAAVLSRPFNLEFFTGLAAALS